MQDEAQFLRAHAVQNGMVRCVEDPVLYYGADARRVLSLFVFAACGPHEIEAETFMAAVNASPDAALLPGPCVRDALHAVLLSNCPEALAPLLASGAFEGFGFFGAAPCLHGLSAVPCTMETRWWAFLCLCGADIHKVCGALHLAPSFEAVLHALSALGAEKKLPQTEKELKYFLSRMPELDYGAAARMLRKNALWEGQEALYVRLLRTREPYLARHLAVTPAELTVAHIRGKTQSWVLRRLLDAVIETPALNTPAALMPLACVLAANK